MKKIFLFIPFLMITLGCVESELVVVGETVGDIVDGETPIEGVILKQYDYQSPAYSNQFRFNNEGDLTNANFSSQNITQNRAVTYTGIQITSITPGVFSAQDNYIYNEQNQLIEINSGATPETKMEFTYDGNNITGTRTLNGNFDNTVTFTLDSYGYINGYSFTDTTDGNTYTMSANQSDNQLNSISLSQNGTMLQQFAYTFDNNINPLFNQMIDYYNILVISDVYGFDAGAPQMTLDTYAKYRSSNNITESTATINGSTATTVYTYEYNSDNYPASGIVSVDGTDAGTVTYTYY